MGERDIGMTETNAGLRLPRLSVKLNEELACKRDIFDFQKAGIYIT